MPKYTITFVKENGFKYHYQTIVEAEDEKQAFLKARDEAEKKVLNYQKKYGQERTAIRERDVALTTNGRVYEPYPSTNFKIKQ